MVSERKSARLRSRDKKATQGVRSKTRPAVRKLDFASESSEDDHKVRNNGVGPESESDKENGPQLFTPNNNQLQDLVVTLFDISDKLLDCCKGEIVFADGERLDVNPSSLTRILRAANEKVIGIDYASDSRDDSSDSEHENLPSRSRNTGHTRNRRIPPKQYSNLLTDENTGDESSNRQDSDQDEEFITGGRRQSPRKRPVARVTNISSEEEDSAGESETSESEVDADETCSSSDTASSVSLVKRRQVLVSSTESESSGNSELEEDSNDNLDWHPKEDNRWDTRKRKILLRKRSESSREKVAKMCEDTDEETDDDSSN